MSMHEAPVHGQGFRASCYSAIHYIASALLRVSRALAVSGDIKIMP